MSEANSSPRLGIGAEGAGEVDRQEPAAPGVADPQPERDRRSSAAIASAIAEYADVLPGAQRDPVAALPVRRRR